MTLRDALFGLTLALAALLGGFLGALLGDLVHLAAGATGSAGLVYLLWSLFDRL